MFKKHPEIKNQVPLRSSDRRKLADQIIRDYQIAVPDAENDTKDTSSGTQPTLSSVRNSLLPESTSSARFTTSSGPDGTLVTGTVYIGAHPDQDKRILWFQSKTDAKLIPTVYTLWNNPAIVPLLHTPEPVVEDNLRHGADLMIPGLVKAPNVKWDSRARVGSIVAVAGTRHDTVPLWIGFCHIDVANLPDNIRGQKGVAVKAIHWAGDECWRWRALGSGGQEPPDSVEGWAGLTAPLSSGVEQLSLGDKGQASSDVRSPGGATPANDADQAEEEPEPSTKEIDDAFLQAFLYSIHKAKANNSGPNFGFDFPILPSYVISKMIQPYLQSHSQHYTMKKTSWKNVKKFIKHLDKLRLVKSKDRSGGETVILDIDFDDRQVVGFTPYKLPKPRTTATGGDGEHSLPTGDPSVGQKLAIQIVYRASPKLVPTILPSKTEFYTAQQVSAALKSYIDEHPEVGGKGSSSVKLDPFLANNVLGSKPSKEDNDFLAAGRISRGALQRRVLEDTHLCQPYHLITRDQAASEQKPKSGPPPRVLLTIEKRTGTKVVTKIANLEPFFVDPQMLAPELQKKCAGSASVGQAGGSKAGMMEVVVQGDQRKMLVGDVFPRRGIDAKWVDVIDKTKGKKK